MTTRTPIKCPPRRVYSKDLEVSEDAQVEMEKNEKLDEKWREKAERELNETPEVARVSIKQLHHLLVATPTVPCSRRDDAFLLRFLRAKKFDVEKAFKMMQKYYSMKEQSPELFRVSPASELRDLLEMQIQCMAPHRDSNGRQLYIFRVEKLDPYKCPVETVFRTNVLALENAVREPEIQIGGLIVLLDMAGASLAHAKFLAPNLSKRTVEVVQEAFPLRFKAFHILHEPFYFDIVLTALKPFLKEKIRRRIHLHGNSLASLHKHISKDVLPVEYGGTQPAFDNTQWRQDLLDDEAYFERLETFTAINGDSPGQRGSINEQNNNLQTDTEIKTDSSKNIPFTNCNGNSDFDYEDDEVDSEYELCSDGDTGINGNLDKSSVSTYHLLSNSIENFSNNCSNGNEICSEDLRKHTNQQ